MILIEETKTSASVLPIDHFKEHLRIGSGFAEDTLQDQVLEGYLRAAISSIEGRTGQALFQRDFIWSLGSWEDPVAQPMPLAPVRQISSVELKDKYGSITQILPGEDFRIVEDAHMPSMRAMEGNLPEIPADGKVDVRLVAGSALGWADVPPDLAQAVLLMAAHYYEYRNDLALAQGCTPFGVTALIERYLPIRLSLGGAS